MTMSGWVQIGLFGIIVIALTRPFGGYMTRVFAGDKTILISGSAASRTRDLLVLRRRREGGAALADLCRRDAALQHVGFALLYACSVLQWYLPFNPQGQIGGRAE